MRWLRRIFLIATSIAGLWFVGLLVIGLLADSCIRPRIERSVASSLGGDVQLGSLDLALIRGQLYAKKLVITREQQGQLQLRVDAVEAEFRPAGLVVFDRDLHRLALRGVRFSATTRAVLAVPGGSGASLYTEEFVIDDGRLELAAGALLPGVSIEIDINHARSGPTLMVTPLSWLRSLREFDATVELPIGSMSASFAAGSLSLSGGLLGTDPVVIDLRDVMATRLPASADAAARRADELAWLAALATRLMKAVASATATRWLGAP